MTADVFLFFSAFLASAVEMVEALTIVLAVGVTRGWRSTLLGVGAATSRARSRVGRSAPAVSALPFDVLRVVVGGLLLVFGLQWLRKAILRCELATRPCTTRRRSSRPSARRRSRRDLDADGASTGTPSPSRSRACSSKGSRSRSSSSQFGAARSGGVAVAAAAALAALVVVAVAGVLARAPLSRVPENTLKFAVGLLLTTFGTFWSAEGAGADWPGDDAALPAISPCSRSLPSSPSACSGGATRPGATRRDGRGAGMKYVVGFLRFWYDFVVGDDWPRGGWDRGGPSRSRRY